jgi:hypothetical protein
MEYIHKFQHDDDDDDDVDDDIRTYVAGRAPEGSMRLGMRPVA